jgi:hypothetical protein
LKYKLRCVKIFRRKRSICHVTVDDLFLFLISFDEKLTTQKLKDDIISMTTLVIVESPAKCSKIQSFLGDVHIRAFYENKEIKLDG